MLVELSVMEQRYHAVMEVLGSRVPVTEVAARYGVSRKSVHAWVDRHEVGCPGWRIGRIVSCPHRVAYLNDRAAGVDCSSSHMPRPAHAENGRWGLENSGVWRLLRCHGGRGDVGIASGFIVAKAHRYVGTRQLSIVGEVWQAPSSPESQPWLACLPDGKR
jgi:hypothetical protein